MRRTVVLAALALLASPAQAQEADTSASDLRCATWAAIAAGASEDPQASQALSLALTWFLGRYEAATGIPFENAITADYIKSIEPDLETIQVECLPRMAEFGERMSRWGAELQRAGS